jgi:hypothetical protein
VPRPGSVQVAGRSARSHPPSRLPEVLIPVGGRSRTDVSVGQPAGPARGASHLDAVVTAAVRAPPRHRCRPPSPPGRDAYGRPSDGPLRPRGPGVLDAGHLARRPRSARCRRAAVSPMSRRAMSRRAMYEVGGPATLGLARRPPGDCSPSWPSRPRGHPSPRGQPERRPSTRWPSGPVAVSVAVSVAGHAVGRHGGHPPVAVLMAGHEHGRPSPQAGWP